MGSLENNPMFKQLLDIVGAEIGMAESPKTKAKKEQEMFCSIISLWDKAWKRGLQIYDDSNIDLSQYDGWFYEMIENLFVMCYGEMKSDIIAWWVYEREGLDGEIAILIDENDKEHTIHTPLELFKFIKQLK